MSLYERVTGRAYFVSTSSLASTAEHLRLHTSPIHIAPTATDTSHPLLRSPSSAATQLGKSDRSTAASLPPCSGPYAMRQLFHPPTTRSHRRLPAVSNSSPAVAVDGIMPSVQNSNSSVNSVRQGVWGIESGLRAGAQSHGKGRTCVQCKRWTGGCKGIAEEQVGAASLRTGVDIPGNRVQSHPCTNARRRRHTRRCDVLRP
jgi:hypothetical protein